MTGGSGGPFATLTHARLRAGQGDVAAAVRILRVILEAQPDHREAREFLATLEDRVAVSYREPPDVPLDEVRPAATTELTARFRETFGRRPEAERAERLRGWIERIRRNRGERRVR